MSKLQLKAIHAKNPSEFEKHSDGFSLSSNLVLNLVLLLQKQQKTHLQINASAHIYW